MVYFQIISLAKAYGNIGEEGLGLIRAYFKLKKVKKGDILMDDDGNGMLYFVNSGIIRAYYRNDDGEQVTRMIAWENRLLTNIINFENFSGESEIIECIEEAEILCITKSDFQQLAKQSIEIMNFFFKILENSILLYVDKAHCMGKSTREKIEYLKRNYRPIIGRVTDSVMASFLSISREHFVRNKKFL
ncbi:Crp/Fnr family transcriptional regulator [Bergeyella sp. RCAD1439]|uniref:Crp/Fnr family transcriptional regulator n=1 Tax=Bergeyella anatis TaxID=3113737 RepID=UPI002E18BFBE|nr:cyclic nucleotide-binding domain-containing protein [Bergeyella sp. RCAD1439]